MDLSEFSSRGGKARMASLTPAQRSELGRRAAAKRKQKSKKKAKRKIDA